MLVKWRRYYLAVAHHRRQSLLFTANGLRPIFYVGLVIQCVPLQSAFLRLSRKLSISSSWERDFLFIWNEIKRWFTQNLHVSSLPFSEHLPTYRWPIYATRILYTQELLAFWSPVYATLYRWGKNTSRRNSNSYSFRKSWLTAPNLNSWSVASCIATSHNNFRECHEMISMNILLYDECNDRS